MVEVYRKNGEDGPATVYFETREIDSILYSTSQTATAGVDFVATKG